MSHVSSEGASWPGGIEGKGHSGKPGDSGEAACGPVASAWDKVLPTLPPEMGDSFEERGCYLLAKAMLDDCVRTVVRDPGLREPETRAEIAWLRGEVEGSPVSADDVFATLRIPGWSSRFAELLVADPVAMAMRMQGLGNVIHGLMTEDPRAVAPFLHEPYQANNWGDDLPDACEVSAPTALSMRMSGS